MAAVTWHFFIYDTMSKGSMPQKPRLVLHVMSRSSPKSPASYMDPTPILVCRWRPWPS